MKLRLRHTDELAGLAVILAVALFLGAMLQAGVLRDWLRPSATLLVMLPEQGTGGLAAGADVEVLGTKAGTVRRITLEEGRRMIAEVQLEQEARGFIRRDSTAVIRRRFGVAGAGYLDITRGAGEPLDWSLAVIEATNERAPTETVGAVLDELRQRIVPILDDVQRTTHAFANLVEQFERGEGAGRFLSAETGISRQLEILMASLSEILASAARVLASLEGTGAQTERLIAGLNAAEGIPSIMRRVDQTLVSLQQSVRDVSRATTRLPRTMRYAEETTSSLPTLLLQSQQTARELEMLLGQLRGMWLLGGSGGNRQSPSPRLPAERVRP